MSLIKLLGGYTKKEYQDLKSKYDSLNREKTNLECQLDNLRVENEKVLKANNDLIRENLKLKNRLVALDTKPSQEEPKSYFMYNSFENMFYVEEGVRYINGQSEAMLKDGSLRAVYNHVWKEDANHKVTFKEFNDEFTKLYNNRNNELVDDYLRNQLIQVKYFTTEIDSKDVHNYTYNESGRLCYRSTMRPVYK